jgi:hypothetical protein
MGSIFVVARCRGKRLKSASEQKLKAPSCVARKTTRGARPAWSASCHRGAHRHQRSPGLSPGKSSSGTGVERSLPQDFESIAQHVLGHVAPAAAALAGISLNIGILSVAGSHSDVGLRQIGAPGDEHDTSVRAFRLLTDAPDMDSCSCSFPQPLERLGCFVCARFTSYSSSLNKLRPAFRLEFRYFNVPGRN